MNAHAQLSEVVRVRPATEADQGRIYSDWLHSHWDTAKGRMPKTVYMSGQHRLIEDLLKKSMCVVACTEEAPDHIIGWASGERRNGIAVLHYVYVKKEYRMLGFGRRLVDFITEDCSGRQHTHETKPAEAFIRSLGSTFNPYITGVAW